MPGMMDGGTSCQKIACIAATLQRSPAHEWHGASARYCLDEAFPEQGTAPWPLSVEEK